MFKFSEYLMEAAKKVKTESDDEGSGKNTVLGTAYETGTALHIHHNSGSSKNKDPEHRARIQKLIETKAREE